MLAITRTCMRTSHPFLGGYFLPGWLLHLVFLLYFCHSCVYLLCHFFLCQVCLRRAGSAVLVTCPWWLLSLCEKCFLVWASVCILDIMLYLLFCCLRRWRRRRSSWLFLLRHKSCPTLCDPMDWIMPGFPVLHYLPGFAQVHVHWVGDVTNHLILCHSLLLWHSVFPNLGVFSSELTLHIRRPKCWSFRFSISPSNEYSVLIL